MGKIINTLRYGKAKTKTFIISVFVLMVVAIVLGIIGINGMNIILLGISMVLFIICILMVFKLEGATADVNADDETSVPKPGAAGRAGAAGTARVAGEAAGRPGATGAARVAGETAGRPGATGTARVAGETAERPGAESPEREALRGDTEGALREKPRKMIAKTRGPKAIRAQLEKRLLVEIIKANKRSAVLDKKMYGKRMKEAVKARNRKLKEMRARAAGENESIAEQLRDAGGRGERAAAAERGRGERAAAAERGRGERDAAAERGRGERDAAAERGRGERDAAAERGRGERAGEQDRESDSLPERGHTVERKTDYKLYTKNEIKRLRKVYKIPKDACKIIIDSCKSLAIDHAPAFFWVKKGRIYILAFEESARCETLPMSKMKVSYKKNLREDEIIKYNSMREMGVYKDFEDMMPTFSVHGGATGNEYFKNLYVLGKDLEITPRSLRSLMTQFDFEIRIFDSLGIKGNYSEYFQKAYEQRIMWTDGVISQNQYQNNIRDILQSMVDDDSIIRYDFMDDLAKMVHHRLITDEYAEFYKNKRL